jgi:predicted metal-binding membrane protein
MAEPGAIERLVKRDQWIAGACLALICALAWGWLAREAAHMALPTPAPAGMSGMQTPGMEMTSRATAAGRPGGADLAAATVMWFLMMVAMMLPSAAPMILLYARFARQAARQGAQVASVAAFAGVYLAVWAGFSLMAAAAQVVLVRAGVADAMSLAVSRRTLAGALLIAAGAYQLTPLKRACLAGCRSPAAFLSAHWRPGLAGAIRLGLRHGMICLGCCWLIMGLLFVGGAMNLAWVAALALVVLIEKVAPLGGRAGVAAGAVALAAGAVMMSGLGWPA